MDSYQLSKNGAENTSKNDVYNERSFFEPLEQLNTHFIRYLPVGKSQVLLSAMTQIPSERSISEQRSVCNRSGDDGTQETMILP